MKSTFYLTVLLSFLVACSGSKSIYHDKDINDKKLEKLIRDYSANPSDTSLANQVRFAYDYLLNQRLSAINQYQYSATLDDKEKLLNAYTDLQAFYDKVRGYSSLNKLLQPGSVGAEIEKTKLELVSGHYEQAVAWLDENNWKSSRDAYRSLNKVQQWMPNYKDTKKLMQQAKQQGTIDAVVLPLHAEGIYYPNTGMGMGAGNYYAGGRLSEQLVRDLGGSYNTSGWYRVYNSYQVAGGKEGPDWSIEPVWTQLRLADPTYNRYNRQVQKQIEVSKDTSGRPVYKTVTATLQITEATYNGYGTLEVRINDEANKQNIARNSWYESYGVKRSWATYTGEAGALSNADWELVNARQDTQPDQLFMEEKLLGKIYSNLLGYVRSYLSY